MQTKDTGRYHLMKKASLTTFNTPFGRYQFTRLPYVEYSAQKVFCKTINQSFDGISQVETNIDDMLILGHSDEDLNRCLIRHLEKAQKNGMTVNVEKCNFKETELIYLGLKLTVNGIELDGKQYQKHIENAKTGRQEGCSEIFGADKLCSKIYS